MLGFAEGLKKRGILRGAESLTTDSAATRVQVRQGRASRADGPFAEANEMIGDVVIIDGATREEAIAVAAECPAAGWATMPTRVAMKLDVIKPFEAHNDVAFTVSPEGSGSRVTWAMEGPVPCVAKFMHIFFNVDKTASAAP